MKDFLKFTLATVTGIILSSIVLFIIGMVTLFGSRQQESDRPVKISESRPDTETPESVRGPLSRKSVSVPAA